MSQNLSFYLVSFRYSSFQEGFERKEIFDAAPKLLLIPQSLTLIAFTELFTASISCFNLLD